MGSILVLHGTQTGNSGKTAALLATGAEAAASTVVKVGGVNDAEPEDLVGCYGLAHSSTRRRS